jgi:hypothetical protein
MHGAMLGNPVTTWMKGNMKIYWSDDAIPELATLSKDERAAAMRACKWKVLESPRLWRVWSFYFLFVIAGGLAWWWAGGWFGELRNSMMLFVCAGLVAGTGNFFLNQAWVEQMRPALREYVARHFGRPRR